MAVVDACHHRGERALIGKKPALLFWICLMRLD
jgi:hypothetical protein